MEKKLKRSYLLPAVMILPLLFVLSCSLISLTPQKTPKAEQGDKKNFTDQAAQRAGNQSNSPPIDVNHLEDVIKKETRTAEAGEPKQKGVKIDENWELIFLDPEQATAPEPTELDLTDEEPNEMEEIDSIFLEALTKPFPREITKFEKWTLEGLGSFNTPVELNRYVEYYIYLFTETKFREHYERWLKRYFKYNKLIRELLRKQGLPDDLIFVAMAESGFSNKAISHAGAVGTWQFIIETAKRYSLKVDYWIDERRDPIKSTIAAAEYLKELYNTFGHWYLAWAGYNAGEKRIERAIQRSNRNDYWYLVKRRLIPRETSGYVPKIIALAIITKNLEKFGFDPANYYEPPWEFDEIEISTPISFLTLARLCDCSLEDIAEFNPQFRHPVAIGKARIPKGKGQTVAERLKDLDKFSIKYIPVVKTGFSPIPSESFTSKIIGGWLQISPEYEVSIKKISDLLGIPEAQIRAFNQVDSIARPGEVILAPIEVYIRPFIVYRVKRRDTIRKIASRFGVLPKDIIAFNNLNSAKVYPGQLIRIPTKATTLKHVKNKNIPRIYYVNSPDITHSSRKIYIARKGDTLQKIAKMHGIKVEEIKRLNNLKSDKIYPGQKILIPQFD